MTAPDSSSSLPPLSPLEREKFVGWVDAIAPEGNGWMARLMAERDALSARVSSLEAEREDLLTSRDFELGAVMAERDEAINKALQAEVTALAPLGALLEKAQEVRRAWDAFSAGEAWTVNPLYCEGSAWLGETL